MAYSFRFKGSSIIETSIALVVIACCIYSFTILFTIITNRSPKLKKLEYKNYILNNRYKGHRISSSSVHKVELKNCEFSRLRKIEFTYQEGHQKVSYFILIKK
ncbi:hypothetical protein SAMN04488096_10454 [Mesonia phycicola]|uniref:Uncharacterized protein n=1 Tax=Mesonia phycicola TaxID=579105 RepID=A0A1M6DL79_9FLAO|nr:hypothetical protein [Mesonia phycicola]SHI73891.1 hypothetical protein SAMN04488096_10454 [Mesonia phycicola]